MKTTDLINRWEKFIEKAKTWADKETNNIGLKFFVYCNGNPTTSIVIKSIFEKTGKKYSIAFNIDRYSQSKIIDEELLAILFQRLRDQYRDTMSDGYVLNCRRKKGSMYNW